VQKAIYQYLPLLIFLGIWSLVLFLYSLNYYNIHATSSEAFSLLIISISAFSFSYICFIIYDSRFLLFEKNRSKTTLNESFLLKSILIYSFISILGSIIIIKVVSNELGGFDAYFERPLSVRQQVVLWQKGIETPPFLLKIGSYITNIGFLSSILGGILFSIGSDKKKYLSFIPIISLLIAQLTNFGRYSFVNGLIFFLLSYILFSYYSSNLKRKKNLLRITVFSSLSLLVLGFLFFYIIKFRSPLAEDIGILLRRSLYFYLTGGIPSLDHFLDQFNNDYTYGQSSFRSLFKWINIITGDQQNTINVHNTFVSISPSQNSNTYTFVKSLYQDFNVYGLIPLIVTWAFLTKKSLYSLYEKFSVFRIMLTCILLFSLFISFFSFYFQSISQLLFWLINAAFYQYFFGEKLINSFKER